MHTTEEDPTVQALVDLRRTKPRQHAILMFALENPELTHEEIAAVFKCERCNITRTILRARKNLEQIKAKRETQKP